MEKYKIPQGTQEILIIDNQLFTYIKTLKKVNNNWIIEKNLIKLEKNDDT